MADSKPFSAALRRRCGVCGQASVFRSYMKLKDECDHCGQDFRDADTADGPSYFVGFALLIFVIPFAVIIPISDLSVVQKVLGYALLIAASIGLMMTLLPIVKALFLNLKIYHGSGQADIE